MILNVKRFTYVMIALTILFCIALVGVGVAGNMLFKKQSDKLNNLRAENQVIKEQEISLIKAKKDIEKYQPLNEIAKSVVPQDKDQAKTVREINAIASRAGIKLEEIAFTSSNLGQNSAPAPTTSGESKPAPKTQTAPLSQVKPLDGIKGVYSLEISIDGGGDPVSYYRFLQFLELLESNRRTAHVSQISLKPTQNSSGVTFSLKLNAYVKP